MGACDMCGAEGELVDAVVEGTMLGVCRRCSSYGSVVNASRRETAEHKPKKHPVEETLYYVVPDYPALVKQGREKKGLKQAELATLLRERESVVHKVENGHMKPSLALAEKLEKALTIVLVVKYEEFRQKQFNFKDSALTIGDLIKLKGKE